MRIILLTLILSGCTLDQALMIKQAGCVVTTEEGRAEIRSKQRVKTNVCQDDLSK